MALLARDAGWRTAGELADLVGVTPRSIRSYVAALNARVPGGDAVESGPSGYRAGAGAAGAEFPLHGAPTSPYVYHRDDPAWGEHLRCTGVGWARVAGDDPALLRAGRGALEECGRQAAHRMVNNRAIATCALRRDSGWGSSPSWVTN